MCSAGAAAAVTAAASSLPLLTLPADPSYWTCMGLGSATVVTTLLFTSRFLMS